MVDEQIVSNQKNIVSTEPVEAILQAPSAQKVHLTSIVTSKAISCLAKIRPQNIKSKLQTRVIAAGQVITYTKSGSRAYEHLDRHVPKS